MLSELSERELAARRNAAREKGDAEALDALEREAAQRLEYFLSEDSVFFTDDSPLFYRFIREFSETKNVGLKMLSKKAEAKILPILKEFDSEMGYDFKNDISDEEMERNLSDMDAYEKEDPFEKQDFRQIRLVLEKIEQIDENGNVMDPSDLKEDILEAARLKTYLRLCLNSDKITKESYFSRLKTEMEILLITLLLMDKTDISATEEEIQAEFEKFLNMVE